MGSRPEIENSWPAAWPSENASIKIVVLTSLILSPRDRLNMRDAVRVPTRPCSSRPTRR